MSPCLFLIVMTVMTVILDDLHAEDHPGLIRQIQANCNFYEMVYADITILLAKDTRVLNIMLRDIQESADKYCIKFNLNKCVAICMYNNPYIKFRDGTQVRKAEEAVYLGVNLSERMNIQNEITDTTRKTMEIWKAFGEYWKHSDCTIRNKFNVLNALVRYKLLYGIESAQLTGAQMQKLKTVQLKGLRQILNIKTTFIDRANTNAKVIHEAQ